MANRGRPTPGLDDYLHWQERLENRVASGMSIADFCAAEEVSLATYHRWMKRLKDGIPDAVMEGETVTMADLAEPKLPPVSVRVSPVEIELPNGGVVRLPVAVGRSVIVDAIQAVTRLPKRRTES